MENLSFTFGKFKDRTIHDVFQEDKGYIMWIIKQNWFKEKFIKHYQCCLMLLKPVDPINENDIIIYTDGACTGNPGPGGWGVVYDWGFECDYKKTRSGSSKHTTNNNSWL